MPLLNFFYYFGSAVVAVILFGLLYIWVTPYPELKLIREGAAAPAISLGGAVIGFALPLASAIVHSANLVDMWIWAGISSLTQILAFFAIRLTLMRGLKIDGQQLSVAILTFCFSLTVGILNAAALS